MESQEIPIEYSFFSTVLVGRDSTIEGGENDVLTKVGLLIMKWSSISVNMPKHLKKTMQKHF